jgi:hypothetical protein
MSARLDKEKEKILSPKRMLYAKEKILQSGFPITFESETELRFLFNNHEIKLFPYSGWHTGKSIIDGRGIEKLLSQLNEQKK